MDELSGKCSNSGPLLARKEPSPILRDPSLTKEQNPRLCSRLGCYGRLSASNAKEVRSSEKIKSTKVSARSSFCGKDMQGTSRGFSVVNRAKSPLRPPLRKFSNRLGTNSSDSTGNQAESISLSGKSSLAAQTEPTDSSAKVAGSSSVGTRSRAKGNFQQNSSLSNQVSTCSPKEERVGTNSRYGIRGLRSNSSNSKSSSIVSADSNSSRKKDNVNKMCPAGECISSPKGKTMCGLSPARRNGKGTIGITGNGSQPVNHVLPTRDNSSSSISSRRSLNYHERSRPPPWLRRTSNVDLNSSPSSPQMSQINPSTHLNDPSTFQGTPNQPASYVTSDPNLEHLRSTRPVSPVDVTSTRSLRNRDSLRRYNIEGISEVLLALERVDNDEELSYEQLLLLETNFFISGVNFFDQHRDMRLDIDNMSYEELLELEERMGSVSTALSEKALSECLKKSIHYSISDMKVSTLVGDDRKCCICQEEYMDGDEVGCLHCDHRYHVACVQQWLRHKNWCPICKASAELVATS